MKSCNLRAAPHRLLGLSIPPRLERMKGPFKIDLRGLLSVVRNFSAITLMSFARIRDFVLGELFRKIRKKVIYSSSAEGGPSIGNV